MDDIKLKQILDVVYSAVLLADSKSNITFLNPEAERLTGWVNKDVRNRPLGEIYRVFHEVTMEPLDAPLSAAIQENRTIKSVRPAVLIRRDGNELYIESTASPIRDDKGVVTGGLLVFHDVSELRELNWRLSYHATHDILTGLANRREFESRLERALKSAKAHETTYALLYLDLDQFKIINDSCGYTAGDTLLHQLGTLLKAKIQKGDTLCRLGGDELGVLLESSSPEETMQIAEALRVAIGEYEFIWSEHVFRLGVSIGIAEVAPDNHSANDTLLAAEAECRKAKRAGGNTVRYAH